MTAEYEAAILADLRRTHAQLKAGDSMRANPTAWSMRLTVEEVDLLLKIVDERDELRRQNVGDWEPEHPPRLAASLRDAYYHGTAPVGLFPETARDMFLEELNGAARTLAEAQRIPEHLVTHPEGCPFRDTIHDCPLGGCPDATPRESEIPDLPKFASGGIVSPGPLVGREARETPPIALEINVGDQAAPTFAAQSAACRYCSEPIVRYVNTSGASAWQHCTRHGEIIETGGHPAEPIA